MEYVNVENFIIYFILFIIYRQLLFFFNVPFFEDKKTQ